MTRAINPVPQYNAFAGVPASSGKMYFYETNSNTPKATYADSLETTANTHPLILDAEGRLPNCFYSGLAKQVLLDANDVQIFSRDPVGVELAIAAFDTYSLSVSYGLHAIVTTSTGLFYKSLTAGNIGLNPLTNDGQWQQISFDDFYSAGVTFSKLDTAISQINGLTYISVTDSNIGNEPSADSTGINWELDKPVLDWAIGKTYAIGDQCYSKISSRRRYAAVISNTGNEPSVDAGTNWLPVDGVVTKPVISAPADTATSISRMPTLTTNAFAITGSANTFEWAQYQLSTDSFATIAYDSGIVRDTPSHIVTSLLDAATAYSYRVYQKGIRTDISDVSTVTTFTTTFPLDEFYSNDLAGGTGAARQVTNNIDLNTGEGMVFIANVDSTDNMRVVDTIGTAGNEIVFPTGGTIRVSQATGLTSFNTTGYSVGALAAYNNTGDDVWSLTLRSRAGLCDVVAYTGTGVAQSPAHIMAAEVGMKIVCYTTGTPTQSAGGYVQFKDMSQSEYVKFGANDAQASVGSTWGTADTTTAFGVGAGDFVNENAIGFIAYLFAHNPAAGIHVTSYLGDGVAGKKITSTFPTSVAIIKSESSAAWYIADKTLGTTVHIQFDGSCQRVASGPVSFDSDGITLNGDTSNTVSQNYHIIQFADKALF